MFQISLFRRAGRKRACFPSFEELGAVFCSQAEVMNVLKGIFYQGYTMVSKGQMDHGVDMSFFSALFSAEAAADELSHSLLSLFHVSAFMYRCCY